MKKRLKQALEKASISSVSSPSLYSVDINFGTLEEMQSVFRLLVYTKHSINTPAPQTEEDAMKDVKDQMQEDFNLYWKTVEARNFEKLTGWSVRSLLADAFFDGFEASIAFGKPQAEVLRNLAVRKHHYCEYPYYSCPKAEGCCDENAVTDCTCGADAHNKEVERIFSQIINDNPK